MRRPPFEQWSALACSRLLLDDDCDDQHDFLHTAIVVRHSQLEVVRPRHQVDVSLRVRGGERECPARARVRVRSDATVEVCRGRGGSPVSLLRKKINIPPRAMLVPVTPDKRETAKVRTLVCSVAVMSAVLPVLIGFRLGGGA